MNSSYNNDTDKSYLDTPPSTNHSNSLPGGVRDADMNSNSSTISLEDTISNHEYLRSQLTHKLNELPNQAYHQAELQRKSNIIMKDLDTKMLQYLIIGEKAQNEFKQQRNTSENLPKSDNNAKSLPFLQIQPKTVDVEYAHDFARRTYSDIGTDDNMQKILKNRVSAQKSRDRQKTFMKNLIERNKELENDNENLLWKVKELEYKLKAVQVPNVRCCAKCEYSLDFGALSPELNQNLLEHDDLYSRGIRLNSDMKIADFRTEKSDKDINFYKL